MQQVAINCWLNGRRGDVIMLVDGCGCNGNSGGMADVHVRGALKCPVDFYNPSLHIRLLL
jgi:hypothetical protein